MATTITAEQLDALAAHMDAVSDVFHETNYGELVVPIPTGVSPATQHAHVLNDPRLYRCEMAVRRLMSFLLFGREYSEAMLPALRLATRAVDLMIIDGMIKLPNEETAQ